MEKITVYSVRKYSNIKWFWFGFRERFINAHSLVYYLKFITIKIPTCFGQFCPLQRFTERIHRHTLIYTEMEKLLHSLPYLEQRDYYTKLLLNYINFHFR